MKREDVQSHHGHRRTWRVGALYRCDATVARTQTGALELVVEWQPTMPRRMTGAQYSAYVAGRDRAVRDLQVELGVRLLLRAVL